MRQSVGMSVVRPDAGTGEDAGTDAGEVRRLLAGLAAALPERRLFWSPGARQVRASLLTEAADGLADATAAYRAAGWSAAEAERQAVADFGPVGEVADSWRDELALSQGRRTALLLLTVEVGMQVSAEIGWRTNKGELWGHAHPSAAYEVLARITDAVAYVPAAMAALLLLVGFGWALRRRVRPALLARITGIGTIVAVACWMVVGASISLATPGIGNNPPILASSLLMTWLPAFWLLASARRCLHAATPPAATPAHG